MSTTPPSYEAAAAQLKDIQSQGVSAQDKLLAEQKVAEALADPQTVKELLDEIRDLSKTTIQIDQDFHKVYLALGQVDNSGYVGTDGKSLPKLQPTWKGFKDRWIQLLWDSRNTATMTQVYLMDFDEVILPMLEDALNNRADTTLMADARNELDAFIKRRNPFAKIVDAGEAASHSQAFTDLSRDLLAFKEQFDDFTKKQQQAVEVQIAGLKKEINSITVEVQKCDNMVRQLGIALGITMFATGVGAIASLVALGPLGPLVALKVLIIGAIAAIAQKQALIKYTNQSKQLRAQLRAKEAELKALEDKLALLKKIQAILEAQKSTIGDIAARISRFGVIWSAINHDAVELRGLMDNLNQSGGFAGVKRRLDLLKATYVPLMQGLKLYATAVDNSGVRK